MGRVGGGIAIIAFGAILTFAVNVDVGFLRIDVVGLIFMLTGLAFVMLGYRGQASSEREIRETHETEDGAQREIRRETHRPL